MSTFHIYRKKEYAAMLADPMGRRRFQSGSIAPLRAPKLVQATSKISAVRAGIRQPASDMLHEIHDYLQSPAQTQNCDDAN